MGVYGLTSYIHKINAYHKIDMKSEIEKHQVEAGLIDFRKSIDFYCNAKYESENETSELLIKACSFTYAIPGYELISPFNRRAIGIILKNKEMSKKKITRTFYAKPTKTESYKANVEHPSFPDYDLPPLLELMTKPLGEDDELDNLRMQLFCWFISPNSKLTPEIILNLPEEHVIVILIIIVLVEQSQICIEEADCLLFANVADSSVKNNINLNHINRIDGRAFRIVFLFTRFFRIFNLPLNVLRLSRYKTLKTFDAVHFHYLQQNWNKAKFTNDLNKLRETYKVLRIYDKNFNLLSRF